MRKIEIVTMVVNGILAVAFLGYALYHYLMGISTHDAYHISMAIVNSAFLFWSYKDFKNSLDKLNKE